MTPTHAERRSHAPNALAWLLVSGLVIVADQWSKVWVVTSLPEHTAVPVIKGWWNWYRSYNTGAAFSFLADAGGWQKYLSIALALGISGLMAHWLRKTPRRDWRIVLPYALVMMVGGDSQQSDILRYTLLILLLFLSECC